MFSTINAGIRSCTGNNRLEKPAILLDLAGLVTLIVLGALSLHHIGGSESLISSLNSVPGGSWGMIAGGVVTTGGVYLINKKTNENDLFSGISNRFIPAQESSDGESDSD